MGIAVKYGEMFEDEDSKSRFLNLIVAWLSREKYHMSANEQWELTEFNTFQLFCNQ
jgi:hypothetical protein